MASWWRKIHLHRWSAWDKSSCGLRLPSSNP